MRHFLDPRNLHIFAETLGTIEALGLLRPGEGSDAIVAAVKRQPAVVTVNRSGLQARLHNSMHDAAENVRLRRNAAEADVRRAVRVAVAGKKSSLIVKAVAEGARGCLPIWEAHAIALDQALLEIER